ncbi:MAG TPA: primosomal protein N' [Patescibacteria group bacterium]|nr:primosomal protein N' [Patescibacteria group bacterium]
MRYAKVVFDLPLEGPFDYQVPKEMARKIKTGCRVKVPLRNTVGVGYVVGLSNKTSIANLKSVLSLLDEAPLLDAHVLELTRKVAAYYCCSWGQAIAASIPEALRKGKILPLPPPAPERTKPSASLDIPDQLVQYPDSASRWDIYLGRIKEVLEKGRSCIVILADMRALARAEEIIKQSLAPETGYAILCRQQSQELKEWSRIRQGSVKLVLGTRAAVYAPLDDLGLIIIDEEHDSVYKQEQVPHYHCREVAFMRARLKKAALILGSVSPSLESIYLAEKGLLRHERIPGKTPAEVKIIDMKNFLSFSGRKHILLSKYLEDSISQALSAKGKVLLFVNRTGFATYAHCLSCGAVLKCSRCNTNLVYHFDEHMLRCHHCSYKIPVPKTCPACNSSYLRYSGTGTEKVESELSRFFPQAKIKRFDEHRSFDDADICIATESIIREPGARFELTGVLAIDNSLNRVDFRSAEKTFRILAGLSSLTDKKLVIQTSLPKHRCFQALAAGNPALFYDEELKERRQLGFPPCRHIAMVKARSPRENKAREAGEAILRILKESNKSRSITVVSLIPGQPPKLRGNFYWQVMVKGTSALTLAAFLKSCLKNFRHSGIIVTVDIDPL